ncbi:MAG TPA: PhoH family protein [Candidatus Ventricola intestinavium]|nr:PhoH family protein [Candidatus Ventricola intestinavium]
MGVHIALRDGEIIVEGGDERAVDGARDVLRRLIALSGRGERVDTAVVQYAVGLQEKGELEQLDTLYSDVVAKTFRGRPIRCKTLGQREYVHAIRKNTLTFGIGPAGTGKTYLAMAMAVAALKAKDVERIVLTRPAVEAGEKLGFLPGDLNQKVDPYLRPLYDAMFDMLGAESCQRLQERGIIEVAPLAYMRGRTLSDAFIILDEAQNTTQEQMKMFLTRMGFRSKIMVTGDPSQIDLPRGRRSGLIEAVEVLEGVEDIAVTRLTHQDVVRHELVQAIVRAYDAYAARVKTQDRAKEETADG